MAERQSSAAPCPIPNLVGHGQEDAGKGVEATPLLLAPPYLSSQLREAAVLRTAAGAKAVEGANPGLPLQSQPPSITVVYRFALRVPPAPFQGEE